MIGMGHGHACTRKPFVPGKAVPKRQSKTKAGNRGMANDALGFPYLGKSRSKKKEKEKAKRKTQVVAFSEGFLK
jgi:hypothetical protein